MKKIIPQILLSLLLVLSIALNICLYIQYNSANVQNAELEPKLTQLNTQMDAINEQLMECNNSIATYEGEIASLEKSVEEITETVDENTKEYEAMYSEKYAYAKSVRDIFRYWTFEWDENRRRYTFPDEFLFEVLKMKAFNDLSIEEIIDFLSIKTEYIAGVTPEYMYISLSLLKPEEVKEVLEESAGASDTGIDTSGVETTAGNGGGGNGGSPSNNTEYTSEKDFTTPETDGFFSDEPLPGETTLVPNIGGDGGEIVGNVIVNG